MKRYTRLIVFILFFSNFLIPLTFAGKWRVNNAGIAADFTTAQAAANSSSVLSGDTLYFEGSLRYYGSLTLTKRLVLIGPGYFLGQNPETQVNLAPAVIEGIVFNPGSKGSVMTGMSIRGWTYVQDTAITLVRNNMDAVAVNGPSHQNTIVGNYMSSLVFNNSTGNMVTGNLIMNTSCYWGNVLHVNENSTAVVRNNIIAGCQAIYNSTYQNNIATGTAAAGNNTFVSGNSTIDHNIGASTQYGTANGNQENVDMALVFVNTGSDDGKYMLAAGSPAIGAGAGGVNCGVFGGSFPYVLSGMPNLPSIWFTSISGNTVTVKAVSH